MQTNSAIGLGPRERALDEGITALGDAELVSVVLGTGLAGRPVGLVAAALLDAVGGLEALARMDPQALAEHPGVGLAKAVRLAASIELGLRAVERAARPRARLGASWAVADWLAPRLGALAHE